MLTTFLPEWDWHCLVKEVDASGSSAVPGAHVNDTSSDAFLLSPHCFGWPLHRPRLFELGTLRGICHLALHESLEPVEDIESNSQAQKSGLAAISTMFQPCKLDCSSILVAPEEFWRSFIRIVRTGLERTGYCTFSIST